MGSAGGRHDDRLLTLGVGLLALAPRLYAAIAWAREPVWDGHYYDFGAQRIAAGLGYSDDVVVGGATVWHPWCHYPVGYSGFLAGLYAIFGSSQVVAPLANAVIGSIMAMLVHRIGLRWLSSRRALIAALLCALHLELILYTPLVMTELLSALGPLLALWLALREARAHPWRAMITSGVVLGLTTLVHPQTILLAPLMGWVVVGRPWLNVRKQAARAAVATAVALAVVAPWTVRNCSVMDGCAFVSTNGGWNLAIGSFSRATGRFETLRAADGCAVVTGQVQQDRCWAKLALSTIRREPGRFVSLIPKKLGYCFDHASFPVEYLREAGPERWPEARRVAWRGAMTAVHRLLLGIAVFGFLAGAVRSRRGLLVELTLRAGAAGLVAYACTADAPTFWPLGVAIPLLGLASRPSAPFLGPVGRFIAVSFALFVVTHIVFFGEDRYHVTLTPLVCLLAAAAFRPSPQDGFLR